jgi:hypothetical protein
MKKKGLLWSYEKTSQYHYSLDKILMETVLKYGDYCDLQELYVIFPKEEIKDVWYKRLINDIRFKKTNYLLARLFFGMDVEADFFKGGMSEREKKLRFLAS